jgi:RNA polymerase subunit RPABC4/transcription elongation factor Spt4
MTERAKRAIAKLVELGWNCSDYSTKICKSCRYELQNNWNYCPACATPAPPISTTEQDMEAAIATALGETKNEAI